MPESLFAERTRKTCAASSVQAGLDTVIIDDDLLSREVLALLAAEAGLTVTAFESGEEALAHLLQHKAPDAVITDVQMPGVRGAELARRLRERCGPATRLVAMSGSDAPDEIKEAYDGFVLKPFSVEELLAVLGEADLPAAPATDEAAEDAADDEAIWDEIQPATYQNLARSMPPAQLRSLYLLCLDDAERRVSTLRAAHTERDGQRFVQAAHAIKGGCSMVGASNLAGLASRMEKVGVPEVDDSAPIDEFAEAVRQLRVMLVAHRAFGGSATEQSG